MSNLIETKSSDVNLTIKSGEDLTYIALCDSKKRTFTLESNANLTYLSVNFTSKVEELVVDLVGEGANFIGKTLTIGTSGLYKYSQTITHKAKNTNSNITNLAISLGDAKVYFETVGHILNKMSNSNCRQLAKGIIVSDASEITAKPILLIDENDVFAYHGAAIGKMSDEALFYLMSRGLNKDEAVKLMIAALINPVVLSLPEEIKTSISSEIEKRIKL